MLVTIDIQEDIRYQQDIKQGKLNVAFNMLRKGVDILFVQHITNLEISKPEEIAESI